MIKIKKIMIPLGTLLILVLGFQSKINAQWKYISKRDSNIYYMESGYYCALKLIDSKLWAGANGLWYSTDLGETWKGNLWNLIADPSDIIKIKDRLIIGGADGGNFISDDGGENWKVKNNGLPFSSKVLSFISIFDSLLYCSTGNGVYFSRDYGENWENKSTGLPYVINKITTKGDTLIAANNNGGVYISTDLGENWVSKNAGLSFLGVFDIAVLDDNIYAATWGGGLCVSANLGNSWTTINGDSLNRNTHCILPYKNFLFVGADDGFFVSTNGGINWHNKKYF